MTTRAKIIWKHAANFSGSSLDVVSGMAVCQSLAGSKFLFTGLDEKGQQRWSNQWSGAMYFWSYGQRIYLGGHKARCVDAGTGQLLVEREYGRNGVDVYAPISSGPVYSGKVPKAIMGLHPDDLSIVWEWPDPEEEYTAHERRLCSYGRSGQMRFVDLATLKENVPVQGPPLSGVAVHGHCGDLVCVFHLFEGGRMGVHMKTGEVVWREVDPGYYSPVFDGDRAYSGPLGLSAYDLHTGKRLWHQSCGSKDRELSCPPRIVNGRAYVGSTDGFIHVVDCRTGELVLSHKLDVKLSGLGHEPSPVVPLGENRIVVGMRRSIVCVEVS